MVSRKGMNMWFGLIFLTVATAFVMNDVSPKNPFKRNPSSLDAALSGYGLFNVTLEQNGQIRLSWRVNYDTEKVWFQISFTETAPRFDWFTFGWSDYGKLENADFCLLWFNWDRKPYLEDTFTDASGNLMKDNHNDCKEFEWDEISRAFSFYRDFDTCDDEDYIIEEGTTHLVWARGSGSLEIPAPSSVPPTDQGMTRVQLLKSPHPPPTLDADARIFQVLANEVHVPSDDTTYWCQVHKLPTWLTANSHHIIQFEPNITPGNEGLVHHMEVFYCDNSPNATIDSYAGSCFAEDRPNSTQVCTKVKAAWAMGAAAFVYPEDAGLLIGGPNENPHLMLEVHYNNPQMLGGFVDSSGINIYVTSKLRQYDAAIMELGLEYTDKMAIPPHQDRFRLSGYCITDCTNIGLPDKGIIIFGSQLHTHLTGVRVITRHFRMGIELPPINQDDHYSTHFQEIRLLKEPVHIMPGDSLITSCDYRTLNRENLTFGGHAITDEMCVNYVHYYPASNLEVCKSSVGTDALDNYFAFENESENMPIIFNDTMRNKYNSIYPWNPIRADVLHTLYAESPISMQCNASNGDRFPGSWDNVLHDDIKKFLLKPKRNCPFNPNKEKIYLTQLPSD